MLLKLFADFSYGILEADPNIDYLTLSDWALCIANDAGGSFDAGYWASTTGSTGIFDDEPDF